MKVYTRSWSLAFNLQIADFIGLGRIVFSVFRKYKKDDVLLGWGHKNNTLKTRKISQQQGIVYWALEDGFISWLNHPTQDKRRLSLIIDKKGIYYDCSAPSGIDYLLQSSSSNELARAQRLLEQINRLNISKYNQVRSEFPVWFSELFNVQKGQSYILLVDQTFGDCSIACAGANAQSFKNMLVWAKKQISLDESSHIIIKVHPDMLLGTKKGYLAGLVENTDDRVHLLAQDVCPATLINGASQVATVSSQLGFEALWKNKQVVCFAWPFYAGRGLTQDLANTDLPYERPQASLLQLLNAALIQYPAYMHPDTQQACEVEGVVDYLQAHFLTRQIHCNELNVHDVSLWKRSFIAEFVATSAKRIRYVSTEKTRVKLQPEVSDLYWGMKTPDAQSQKKMWRMEDGFIRSVGLGADLRRPTSLIIDDLGIYYNGKKSSRLEVLLSSYELNEYETQRTQKLLTMVQQTAITKYNVESAAVDELARLKQEANGREIILVTGQFQQDLSMQYGTIDIKTNMGLLQKVSQQFPRAYIIYKEHPDVFSGVRPGKLDDEAVLTYADAYITNINITSLFTICERVCTICSLSGFEALLRGIKVSTYGLPFYAGWGLTDDYHVITRRKRKLSLLELTYVCLVLYPRYINWHGRNITTLESVIMQLSSERNHPVALKSAWISRQNRKIRYLMQALFSRKWGAN